VRPRDPAAAALRLLLFTGCRLREILHLRWEHVDFERGLLLLPTSKTTLPEGPFGEFTGYYAAADRPGPVMEVTAIHHRGGGVSADRALSRREIDIVKRDRLGWAYPVVIAAHGLYRIAKRIVRPRQEPA
jgi:integrase